MKVFIKCCDPLCIEKMGFIESPGLSLHLNGSSGEEQPVGGVWRVQVVLEKRGFVGSVDQQHIVQPPTGLIAFRALGSFLRPTEAHAIGLGVVREGEQVDDGAAVSRCSVGEERNNTGLLVSVCV